jgi:hypothetical protein
MIDNNEFKLYIVLMMWIGLLAICTIWTTCGTPERMCLSETSEVRQQQCMDTLLKLRDADNSSTLEHGGRE